MNLFVYNRSHLLLLISFILSVFLAYLSGWRDIGIDRDNYIGMYQAVIVNKDWTIKLWYAKDVMFLLIATFSNYFSDEEKLAFFLICFFSVVTKYHAIRVVSPRHTLLFILMYAVFLSPGLEFAAMRSALAIGFLMLVLVYRNKKIPFIIFSLLAILSHSSSLIVLIFVFGRLNDSLSKHKIGYVLIALGISLLGPFLFWFIPHSADYENNQGTFLAYSTPLATFFISILIFFRLDKICTQHPTDLRYEFIARLRTVVYSLIAVAFGISSLVVTASTRYLEISWCIMLFASVFLFNKTYINFLGGFLLLVFLTYINILRTTWAAIFYPILG